MRFNIKKILLRLLIVLICFYFLITLRNWLQDTNILSFGEYPSDTPSDLNDLPEHKRNFLQVPMENKPKLSRNTNLNARNINSPEQQTNLDSNKDNAVNPGNPALPQAGSNKSSHIAQNSPPQLTLPFGLEPTDLYSNQLFSTLGTFYFDSASTFQRRLPILPSEGDSNEDRITNEMRFMPEALVALRKAGKKLPMKRIVFMSGGGVEPGQTRLKNDNCPVKECSYELHSSNAADADVLMWQQSAFMPGHRRPRNQLWVLYLLESPYHTPDLGAFRGQFNITATYRHDSTIVAPYYRWQLYNSSVRSL